MSPGAFGYLAGKRTDQMLPPRSHAPSASTPRRTDVAAPYLACEGRVQAHGDTSIPPAVTAALTTSSSSGSTSKSLFEPRARPAEPFDIALGWAAHYADAASGFFLPLPASA